MTSYLLRSVKYSRLYCSHQFIYKTLDVLKYQKTRTLTVFQSNLLTSRYLCSKVESNSKNDTDLETHKFHEIYRFKGIRLGYSLHKMKWVQTLLAGATLPISLLLYLSGIITFEWYVGVSAGVVTLTLNMYAYALLFHRAIGFMYLSEDGSVLKISYLDYWGKRIDEEISVDDVMPFSEVPRQPTEILFKEIVFYSNRKVKPKLYLNKGQITDTEKFSKVFGSSE